MKAYVATTLSNWERAREAMAALRACGAEITWDWTQHGRVDDPDERVRISQAELAGVRAADCLLLIWPAMRGAHFEFGVAYERGTPVVELADADAERSVFSSLPGVVRCRDLATAVAAAMGAATARAQERA